MYVHRDYRMVGMMRYTMLIVLVLIAISLIVVPAHASSNWIEIQHVGKGVLYDYDRDGVVEIVVPEGIIEGTELIKGAYPNLNVTLIDINGDGINELVFYGNGKVYVYDGETLEGEFAVPDTKPIITPKAIAFGNVVIWHNKSYTIGENVTYVVPVATQNNLYALYLRNGVLNLLDVLSGEERVIYPDKFQPLYAVLRYNYIDILALSPEGNLAVIRYYLSVSSRAQVSVYTIAPQAVIGYDPTTNGFYIKADNKLYRASLTGLLLVSEWEPVSWERSYVYLYSNGELIVYDYEMHKNIADLRLPTMARPETVFGYPRTVVSYSDKSYLLVGGPVPRVTFIGSPSVYAGETYTFKVVSNVNYTIMIDGAPGNTTWVFKKPGIHNITIAATNGVVTRTFTFKVYVSPRPLILSVRVLEAPRIFGTLRLNITTLDALNKTVVHVPCTVRIDDKTFNGTSGYEMIIPVGMIYTEELRVMVACGGGIYDIAKKTFYVPVQPVPATPIVSYLGDGKVEITFHIANTSIPINGTAEVYIGDERVYRGKLPITLELSEGNNTLKIKLYPSVSTIMQTTYTLNIVYAGNVSTVPSIPGYKVLVANKVINKTKIVYRNQTITKVVPRYIHVKELDTKMALFMLTIGIAAGIPVGIVVTRLKKPRAEEKEIEYTDESEKEDSVEFEET